MSVRKFDEQKERVESGPIQFGEDWPGLFLRGKHALYFGFMLGMFLDGQISKEDGISMMTLRSLQRDLMSCSITAIREEENGQPKQD